ncbi:phage integrase SAM-like domain-containing protein, partial [candidate division WOR-3 bacterium]|nr:phage integrase SAM-like domain-containing protein [candidate division WOR-3 bacterium]
MNLRRRAGRWYVRFTLDGKQWERSTGETDRDKALCKISEIVKQVAREIELGYTGKTKVVTTLSELAKEYIPYAEAHKAKSTVEKEASKMKLLVSAFGERKLTGITVRDIELYMQHRSKVVKPRTVNLELALLRHMLNKAIDWGYLKGNPAKMVKPFKEPPGRIRYLRRDEYDRLLSVCQLTPGLYEIVLT